MRPPVPRRPPETQELLVSIWVRILRTVAAAHGFPILRAAAVGTGRQGLHRLHAKFVAAVRAAIRAGLDITSDWNGLCHLSSLVDEDRCPSKHDEKPRSRNSAEERVRRRNRPSADPPRQADASTRITTAHMPTQKMALSAKAAAKSTPIAAQSRPDVSVVIAAGSSSPLR